MVKSMEPKFLGQIEEAKRHSEAVPRPGHVPRDGKAMSYKAVDPKMPNIAAYKNISPKHDRFARIRINR